MSLAYPATPKKTPHLQTGGAQRRQNLEAHIRHNRGVGVAVVRSQRRQLRLPLALQALVHLGLAHGLRRLQQPLRVRRRLHAHLARNLGG